MSPTPKISIDHTEGDTLEPLTFQLTDLSGAGVSLTGTDVTFFLQSQEDQTLKVDAGACTIIDSVNGWVKYEWADADVDTPGKYWAWFVRTRGGKKQHHPVNPQTFEINMRDVPNATP